ncbi:prepilin peptidase [Patescibacteria group bacterium]|nr:prepilin peptidase [Patescibacteria group bacterium]
MFSFVIFLFGLVVGSFLNAFIYRLEVQQKLRSVPHDREKVGVTVMRGRSFCPSCSHTLAWQDLIPLLSFALLKGRCRYCKEKISFQYPLIELATGLLFVAVLWFVLPELSLVIPTPSGLKTLQGLNDLVSLSFPQVAQLAYLWTIVSLLTVIFVYDLKHFVIPDKVLYPAILVVGMWYLVSSVLFDAYTYYQLLITFYSALGAAGFFLAIYLLSKGRAMGFGDVKLALFMGLFLSWPNILVAMSLAFAVGAIVGLTLIFLKRKTMRSEVPFGSFLILGTLISLFWGDSLVYFYISLLGV